MTKEELERRIAAATAEAIRLRCPDPDGEAILRAAFPELFADPPTHWLAPVEPTEAMVRYMPTGHRIWEAMRDAYLGAKP